MKTGSQSLAHSWRGVARFLLVAASAVGLMVPLEAGAATINVGADANGDAKHHFVLASLGSVGEAVLVTATTCFDAVTLGPCNLNPSASSGNFTEYFVLSLGVDGTAGGFVSHTLDVVFGFPAGALTVTLFTDTDLGGDTVGDPGATLDFDDADPADRKVATEIAAGQYQWSASLTAGGSPYVIQVEGERDDTTQHYEASVNLVPLPPAAILLVSAIVGIVGIGARRKHRQAA